MVPVPRIKKKYNLILFKCEYIDNIAILLCFALYELYSFITIFNKNSAYFRHKKRSYPKIAYFCFQYFEDPSVLHKAQ